MGTLWRYLRIYRSFLAQSLKMEMIYRTHFLTLLVLDGVLVGVNVAFFHILYRHVDHISGWTFPGALILLGTVGIVREMAYLLFRRGFLELGDEVRRGLLDYYLIRPLPVTLQLGFRHISVLDSLGEGVLGVILVVYGLTHLEAFSWWTLPLYGFYLINSLVLYYGFCLLVNSVVFWVIQTQELNTIVYFFMETARYPGDIYRGLSRWIFTLIIPVGVIATVPASILVGPPRPGALIGAVLLAGGFLAAGLWVWHRGLRHYASASN